MAGQGKTLSRLRARLPGEAGPLLDRQIERTLHGDRAPLRPAPYSRDDEAADGLVRQIRATVTPLRRDAGHGTWYCVWWRIARPEARPERLATGSAPTRPLSICRAVLNLPEGLRGERGSSRFP